MIHKRAYIYIIGVLLAASCSQLDVDRPDSTISFTPVAAKPTKAIISGSTYPTSESFAVSAYHNGTAAYFEDLRATYSSSLNLWATAISQYWPLAGSLTFIAASPWDAPGVSITSSGVSATGYTIQNATQMTTDLCYASATVADCSNHPESVNLTFSHALAQVVFRVKAAGYYNTGSKTVSLSMTSLSLSGVLSAGDFASETWSDQNTPYNYDLSSSAVALTYDGSNNPVTADVCSFLFIPQEIPSDARINVGYSVVQTVSGTPYTLENAPVAIPLTRAVTEWQPGKKYIYTLNIGLNNLISISVGVAGWQDENANIIVEES